MKITLFRPVVTRALILVAALVIAFPAAADLVGMRQLEAGVSGKPASGFFASLTQSNLKESGELTPELRWGNDDMHQRYYSPVLARFVSVDPVAGKVGSSQSANRYSYVLNNPVRLVDPDGRFGIEAAVGVPLEIPAPPQALLASAVLVESYGVGRKIGQSQIVPGDTVDEFYTDLFDTLINSGIPDVDIDNLNTGIPAVQEQLNGVDSATMEKRENGKKVKRKGGGRTVAEPKKPGRKKQGRESRNKNRKKKDWKPHNRRPPKEPPKHTPSRKN